MNNANNTPANNGNGKANFEIPSDFVGKLKFCAVSALPSALKTGFWLLKIMVPISFAVLLLKHFGLLKYISDFFEPVFVYLGLPGEGAIVFITSCLLSIYSSIGVIATLKLKGRVVTILALMCLISHNLIVEGTVQKKTGTSAIRVTLIRLISSFAGALALNKLLPLDSLAEVADVKNVQKIFEETLGFNTIALDWLRENAILCVKIMVLITLLMILQRILDIFGIARLLSIALHYPLKILGLARNTAFLWIIANTIGLAYGSGVIINDVKRGNISRSHTNSLNYHIAVSHSLLEDTLLFVAIGVSVWWITIPRIILAGLSVWLNKLCDYLWQNIKARF
jgi:hypothetical protein